MKYQEFINNCRNKDYSNLLTQKHHITPVSVCLKLGWTEQQINDPSNLIDLSLHDHFWAHVYYYQETGLCGSAPSFILISYNAKSQWTEEEFNEVLILSYNLISISQTGKTITEEQRQKISMSLKGQTRTIESRIKMSKSQIGKTHTVSTEARDKISLYLLYK